MVGKTGILARGTRAFLLASLLGCVTACATVDRFGSRVVTYNRQLESSRKTGILDNILRSGYGEPLQFSDVSTVTGQGSVQGSIGSSLPFFGTRAGGARLFSLSPGLQANGGPSFAVANLNNQEFFSGITSPLTNDQIANYISNGATRASILFLTVAAIDFDRGKVHYHFVGDPSDQPGFAKFASTLGTMIDAGLSFDTASSTTFTGPRLSDDEVAKNRVLSALLGEPSDSKAPTLAHFSLDATSGEDLPKLSDEDRAWLRSSGRRDFYRLTQSAKKVRFCFIPKDSYALARDAAGPNADHVPPTFGSQTPVDSEPTPLSLTIGQEAGGASVVLSIGADNQCGISPSAGAKGNSGSPSPNAFAHLTITLRSVRGIFGYLGVMARAELDRHDPSLFDFGIGQRGRDRIFGVEAVAGETPFVPNSEHVRLAAAFGEVRDLSPQTVQLLSELMALNSSAKALPVPNVIPFFTP